MVCIAASEAGRLIAQWVCGTRFKPDSASSSRRRIASGRDGFTANESRKRSIAASMSSGVRIVIGSSDLNDPDISFTLVHPFFAQRRPHFPALNNLV
jgi:hypothetical protein